MPSTHEHLKIVESEILQVFERLRMPLSQMAIIEILKHRYSEDDLRRGTRHLMSDYLGKLRLRIDWRLELAADSEPEKL